MVAEQAVPVFFLSDSTGISAETMGNALLIQFPDLQFERRLFPFISTVEEARRVVAILDAAMDGPVTPLVFTTAAVDEIRAGAAHHALPDHRLLRHAHGAGRGARSACAACTWRPGCTASATSTATTTGWRPIEFAMEHDDGQSLRALDKAEVILLAPSRCGKTPTTMYLALQHGIYVANYPLVDEDFESVDLPRPLRELRDRCFGILTTPERLSQVRDRAPGGVPVRVARAVHPRAAPRRGDVPAAPDPDDQLLGLLGRGDGHRGPAAAQERSGASAPAAARFRRRCPG